MKTRKIKVPIYHLRLYGNGTIFCARKVEFTSVSPGEVVELNVGRSLPSDFYRPFLCSKCRALWPLLCNWKDM